MPPRTRPTKSSEPSTPAAMTADANGKQNAAWTHEDIVKLLEYLISQIATSEGGGNFKMQIFTAAARILNEIRAKGGPKTGKGCQNKYKALRATHQVVDHIKNHASGFTYSDDHSADIGPASASAWDTYCIAHPDAKPFRNKGWLYLEQMEKLIPSQARGNHVFRPGAAENPIDLDSARGNSPSSADAPGSPTVWNLEDFDKDDSRGDDDDDEGEKDNGGEALTRAGAVAGSRKRAAVTPSQPPKRARYSAGAQALSSIASAAHDMNEILGGFRQIFAPLPAQPAQAVTSGAALCVVLMPSFVPSDSRPTSSLMTSQFSAISSGENIIKADMYNALIVDSIRVKWVRDQLRKHALQHGLDFSI
ncbi:Myb-DNA-bind-3 domain-containing protein [Mycena venus]|uniref:Myb-DNA-bind-3 domain-containing protein n=1 Tax=Mycena venus TaxID=2733690 RepID=A0A8H6Z8C9_9AGAR|nr:Myb-DNA-bind-3 domain-containing protein [Mycena venus]